MIKTIAKNVSIIANGVIPGDVTSLFDLKSYAVPSETACHVEVVTASYKLNGLLKNDPPKYDPDIASKSEILVSELDFQNKYNQATGHAIRLDIFSREATTENWQIEASKLIYRTGLLFTNEDLLYPLLTVTNVWLINPTTEVGAKVLSSRQLLNDDYLMIKVGIVVKTAI